MAAVAEVSDGIDIDGEFAGHGPIISSRKIGFL